MPFGLNRQYYFMLIMHDFAVTFTLSCLGIMGITALHRRFTIERNTFYDGVSAVGIYVHGKLAKSLQFNFVLYEYRLLIDWISTEDSLSIQKVDTDIPMIFPHTIIVCILVLTWSAINHSIFLQSFISNYSIMFYSRLR